jgi:hypothetical protein
MFLMCLAEYFTFRKISTKFGYFFGSLGKTLLYFCNKFGNTACYFEILVVKGLFTRWSDFALD